MYTDQLGVQSSDYKKRTIVYHEDFLGKYVNPKGAKRQALLIKMFFRAVLDRVPIDEDMLPAREFRMIDGVLHGQSIAELADELGVTPIRARQIYYQALRHLPHWGRRIQEQEAEIERLREKIKESIPPVTPELLATRLEECGFSERTSRALQDAELTTVADMVKLRRTDLLRSGNIGKNSLFELDDWLEEHGLSLGMKI